MSTRAEQRQLTLSPAPDSARHARRFVGEVLSDAGVEDETVDVALLLTSELVTNGIVHANTVLRVVVDVATSWLRIDVSDGNPNLPSRRDYDVDATTGRGLEMVELLSQGFGAESLNGHGKRVWFRLVRGGATGVATYEPAADLDAWPDLDEPADVAAEHHSARVVLAGLPLELYCAWQQHADSLLREATLVAIEDNGVSSADYPLAAQALGALATAASGAWVLRDAGQSVADVRLDIGYDALPWFPVLRDLLARGTAMSVSGKLLTPPSLPEIVALRNWVCDEVARQAAGLPPHPWAEIGTEVAMPAGASPESLDGVRRSTRAQLAADASNRIVAVSPSAAALLGWDAGDLEGRRLVTIIPSRLRDRHIAGFTRFLLDGTGSIIGRPVQVPARRQDGSEVEVSLLIERRHDPAARALFVATLD